MDITRFEIHDQGLHGLRLVRHELPAPGPHEVRLRMRAMALNFRDLEIVLGTYRTAFRHQLVPLSDGVAEVVEVGSGVTRVSAGDRVMLAFWERWIDGAFQPGDAGPALGGPASGVLAQECIAAEERLVKVPAGLTDTEAACLPCAATTAWHALVSAGRIKPGDTVLVQGTGGVALAALQISLMAGARPIVTSSSDAKLARAAALGAHGTVNYKDTPQWAGEVLAITAGRGVDHVIELGGPGSFAQSLRALRPGGQVNVIGYLGGTQGTINPLDIFRLHATVRGIPVGSRTMLEQVATAYAAGRMKPVIDRSFDWTEAPEALRWLQDGQHFGKIVLTV